MKDALIYSYYNNQHYLKVGSFSLLTLLTFCYFIPGLGDFKVFFLFFLLFIIPLTIEFIIYHKIMTEFKKGETITKEMRIAEVKTYEMRKKIAGLLFLGIVDGKVMEFKLFRLDPNIEKKIPIISKYKKLLITYYPKSRVITEFHGINEKSES